MLNREVQVPNWAFISVILGMATLIISWLNYRRNNKFCLEMEDCRFVGRSQPEFTLLVRNYGLQLYHPSVRLVFDADGQEMSVPLRRRDPAAEFPRGKAIRFVMRADRLGKADSVALRKLTAPCKQRVRVRVYSQGNPVADIPMPNLRERARKLYARLRNRPPGVTSDQELSKFLREVITPSREPG